MQEKIAAVGAFLYKHAEVAPLGLLTVFAPIKPIILALLGLVFADMVLGLIVAFKKKHKITSSKLKKTIVKMGVYILVLCSLFLAETFLHLPIPAVKTVTGLISIVELKSLLEHANRLTDGNVFKAIIEKLGQSGGSKNEEEKKDADK